jgi:CCR4-NOT transcriptional regulation complex NOT5 subunit
MNLKLLILGVFTAWIVLCTKWYVCEIQQSCYEDTQFETVARTSVEPATQPLAVAADPIPSTPQVTVPKKVEKKPEVVKTVKKVVKSEKTNTVSQKSTAKSTSKSPATTAKPEVRNPNLTAKGGTSVVSATKTTSSKSTRQVLVEKVKTGRLSAFRNNIPRNRSAQPPIVTWTSWQVSGKKQAVKLSLPGTPISLEVPTPIMK